MSVRTAYKDSTLLALALLYVLVVGQNWATFAAALMVAAYVRHHGRLFDPM